MHRIARSFVFVVGWVTTGILSLGVLAGLFALSAQFVFSAAEPAAASPASNLSAYPTYVVAHVPSPAYPAPTMTAVAHEAYRPEGGPLLAAAERTDSHGPQSFESDGYHPPASSRQTSRIIEADDPFGSGAFGPPPGDIRASGPSDDPFGAMPAPFIEDEPDDAAKLRQKRSRLASLAGEAAALLDAAELDRRIAEFERTLAEKRAEADLAGIRVVLEEITTTFPETPAAEKARRMLDAAATQSDAGETGTEPTLADEPGIPVTVKDASQPVEAPLPFVP